MAKMASQGEALEQPLFDHARAAVQHLFRRLENQMQRAVEVARLRQVTSGTEQHGGVTVMATGVHAVGHAAAPGLAVVLLDRQGVHIGAQPEAFNAIAHLQRAHHAGARQSAVHLIAPRIQIIRHQIAGAKLFETQFRVLMNIVPNGRELR